MKKHSYFPLMLILLFIFQPYLLAQTNYYVDPTGTDDGSHGTGTGTNAWATIQFAIDNVSDPTTETIIINVASGIYDLWDGSNTIYIGINRAFNNLTIKGAGEGLTIVQGNTSALAADAQVFDISGVDETVSIEDMTIRYGNYAGSGGAISNNYGTLSLINCTISDNISGNTGGGIFNKGDLTITNCTISNNSAAGGGGIQTRDPGTLVITNSTISNNNSNGTGGGGGIYNYAGSGASSPISITNSTISGNTDIDMGGGISNLNYGISADITITNSTISSNTCTDPTWCDGAGIYNDHGNLILTNCTICENSLAWTAAEGAVNPGAGFYSHYGSLTIKNTLIGNNTYADGNSDYFNSGYTTLTDNGYNIVEHTNVGAGAGGFTNSTNNDIVGDQVNLNLGVLADNGGSTFTHALSSGSVAIDAGLSIQGAHPIATPVTDQREFLRDGNTDIGAYEFDAPTPVELIFFSANLNGNSVELNWKTATEVNNYGFEIERALTSSTTKNGLVSNWKYIGFVEGSGNSNSLKSYSYIDDDLVAELSRSYRLKQIDIDGNYKYSDIIEINMNSVIPNKFELFQNYPNPFNPSTTIRYSLPVRQTGIPVVDALSLVEAQHVTLKVYDILGNEVTNLVNKNQSAGNYEVVFNAAGLASGVYLYKLQTSSGFISTKKLVLLR